jgi:hypothetical protein
VAILPSSRPVVFTRMSRKRKFYPDATLQPAQAASVQAVSDAGRDASIQKEEKKPEAERLSRWLQKMWPRGRPSWRMFSWERSSKQSFSVVAFVGPAGLRAFNNANHAAVVLFHHEIAAVHIANASDLLALDAPRARCMSAVRRKALHLPLAVILKVNVTLRRVI